MDEGWKPEDQRWLRRLKKIIKEKPDSVLLYTLDGEIIACKAAIPSYDCCEIIAHDIIEAGAMLTDLHDDPYHGTGEP